MQLLLNEAIYRKVIVELLPQTRKFLWIVTADIKDLHVPKGRRFVPLPEILSDLVGAGVSVRLMHAKEPGPRFREDFDKYPNLVSSDLFERILCPRIHTNVGRRGVRGRSWGKLVGDQCLQKLTARHAEDAIL